MNEYQNHLVGQNAHSAFNQPSGHASNIAEALITPELLHSFVVEVKGYLPRIESGIAEFFDNPAVMEQLAEAHGYAHTIKKAAQVMGMLPLASLAERLQGLLEQLAIGALPMQGATLQGFRQVVAHLGVYLDHSAIGGALPPTELIEALYALEHPTMAMGTEAAVQALEEAAPLASEPAPELLEPPQMYILSEEFQTVEAAFDTDSLAEPPNEYYAEPTINARTSGRLMMPAATVEPFAEPQPIIADLPPVYVLTSQYEVAHDEPTVAEASYVAESEAFTFIADDVISEPVRKAEPEVETVVDTFAPAPAPDWWSQHYVEEAAYFSPYAVTSHLEPLAPEPPTESAHDFVSLPAEALSATDEPMRELRTTQELPVIHLEAEGAGLSENEVAPEFAETPPPPPAPPYPPVLKTAPGFDEAPTASEALAEADVLTQELPDATPAPWVELPLEPAFVAEAETLVIEDSRPTTSRLAQRLADFGAPTTKPEGWGAPSNSSASLSSSPTHSRSDWAARYAQPEAVTWRSQFVSEAAPQNDEVIPTAPLPAAVLEAYEAAVAQTEENAPETPATYVTWEGKERPRTSFDAQTVWGQRHWEVELPDTIPLVAPLPADDAVASTAQASVSDDPLADLLAQLSPDASARGFEPPAAPPDDSLFTSPAAEPFAWDDEVELAASPTPAASSHAVEWEAPAELLEIFLPEAEEHLTVITTSLPKLASHPDNKNLLQEIRRSAHSLKGSSAVVGFHGITKLAHRMEDLLDLLYDGELALTSEMLDLLFSSTEALENLLSQKSEPELIDSLYAAYDRILAGHEEAIASADSFVVQIESAESAEGSEDVRLPEDVRLNERAWAHAESVSPLRDLGTFPSLAATLNESLAQRALALTVEPGEDAHKIAPAAFVEVAPTQSLPELAPPVTTLAAAPAPSTSVEAPDSKEARVSLISRGNYVRVPIERLDAAVKLVTELIVNRATLEQNMEQFNRQLEELRGNAQRLSRVANRMEVQYEASSLDSGLQSAKTGKAGGGIFVNALNEATKGGSAGWAAKLAAPVVTNNTYGFDALEFDRYTEFHLLLRELTECSGDMQTLERELRTIREYFESTINRQGRLNSEMQDQLMRLRMVPLASLSSRFHRTAHQVAQQRNKQVNFIIEGEDTRLDKTVIEEIVDPLLHILRNAIDHGIEPAFARRAAGKAAAGTVRLRAFHEGTQTVLQITDDGMGLHPERLRAKAIQSGVVLAADAARFTEDELFALIFLPGFSTAAEVSEISGRGVGLDVVKTTIQRLKGRIDLDSTIGGGTTFTIRLPMTLAVMRALLVKAHKQTFAIPPVGLQQIVRLTSEMLDRVGEQHVIRVNNKIYSLMQLGRLLNLRRASSKPEVAQLALLLNLEDRQFAIAVDETLGGRDVVVKNLGNHLREVRGITGTTLMGDGSAVLILNLPELVRDALRPASTPTGRLTAQPVTQRPRVRPPLEQRGPLHVMVIDDSLSVRRVLANRFNAVGWKPMQAKDGLDALEQLQGNARLPDAILLDIEMPRMDGYEFLSALRKHPDYAQIPVVMITSRAGQKRRDRAFEAGANEYLVKPYQDEELLTLIRRLARVTE